MGEDDRSKLSKILDETEDWMYEDGEDETKDVYVNKLAFLRGKGDPIEERYLENGRVIKECQNAMTWLNEKTALQDNTPKTVSPVIMSFDIIKKKEVIERVCNPIMSKPAPAPKPEPKEEEKKEEEQEASPMQTEENGAEEEATPMDAMDASNVD